MKTLLFWPLILAALSICPAVQAAAPDANFILIGWDGTQPTRLAKMRSEGRLPNLEKLIKEGGYIQNRITTGKTETKPGWTEILTGYSSERLDIPNNNNYKPIPAGYTVFERLKTRFGEGIATIFLAGKRYNLGARGPHEICINAKTRDDVTRLQTKYQDRTLFKGKTQDGQPPRWVQREGEPYFNAAKVVDHYSATADPAEVLGKNAIAALEKYSGRPFFAFFHFKEPDEEGHEFGEQSAEYEQALTRTDHWLGEIVQKLKALGLYSKTTIFVTCDHGMELGKKGHDYAPDEFLATNSPKKMHGGDRKDVTPSILDWYGFDLKQVTPPLDGQTLFVK